MSVPLPSRVVCYNGMKAFVVEDKGDKFDVNVNGTTRYNVPAAEITDWPRSRRARVPASFEHPVVAQGKTRVIGSRTHRYPSFVPEV